RVMRLHSAVLRRKTECDGHVEFFERLHLPVEPRLRVRPEAVGPAQTGSEITDSQAAQPVYCRIEPMILEVKPLADAELRRIFREALRRDLRCAVFVQQAHIEMTVIR